jgi:hypothetical protein
MKLKYRGVSYEVDPPMVAVEPTALTGRYRGVPYLIPNLTTEPIPQPIHNLVYRGVPYQVGDFIPEEVVPAEEMISAIEQGWF